MAKVRQQAQENTFEREKQHILDEMEDMIVRHDFYSPGHSLVTGLVS